MLVTPVSGQHALRLQLSRAEPGDLFEIATIARRVFDLSADPAVIAEVLCADPLLKPLARRHPGLRIPGVWDAFECTVRALLAQSTSVCAARHSAERLVQRTGDRVDGPGSELTHLFPSCAQLAEADLSDVGLSAGTADSLRALARAVGDGAVDLAAPADEVVGALTALPSVGQWGAQYVAMRALGEPDAFPCDDWVKRHVAQAEKSSPEAIRERAEAWRPWRGYATIYLWRAAAERQDYAAHSLTR